MKDLGAYMFIMGLALVVLICFILIAEFFGFLAFIITVLVLLLGGGLLLMIFGDDD